MLARGGYYQTSSWRARSQRQLERFPLCAACGGRARIADHVQPRGLGGADDGVLQSLCVRCHNLKSSSEGGKASKAKREASRAEPK